MAIEKEPALIDLDTLQRKLNESETNCRVENDLKLELSGKNPSDLKDYLFILKSKLLSIKQCEQILACPSGLTSKTKEAILSGVISQPIFVDVINNIDKLQKKNIQDINRYMQQDVSRLSVAVNEKKHDIILMKGNLLNNK